MEWQQDEFGNRTLHIAGWRLDRCATDATVYGEEIGGDAGLEVTAGSVQFIAEVAMGGQHGTYCTERMSVPFAVVAAAIAEVTK